MDIPNHAKLIFGVRWGGWAWMSITPNGRFCWWVAYNELGVDAFTVRRFWSVHEIELFFDAVDLGEIDEPCTD